VNTEQAIYQGAVPGMLRKLDPHSIFFDPQQNEQLKEMENPSARDSAPLFRAARPRDCAASHAGTPVRQSGANTGRRIVAINDIALARLNFEQLVGYLGEARQHGPC